MGDGIYKSTDAGATWKNIGLAETGRIGRILIHPTDPQIVVCLRAGPRDGPAAGARRLRTTDGGGTWKRVLFVDANTGCSGISMDAKNPDVLFAGTWQVRMQTHLVESGGPGSGVYLTRDGGATWTKAEGWTAEAAGREGRRGDCAVRLEPRVRADPDAQPGLALAVGRRRRHVEGRELGSDADRPGRLLHPHRGQPGERRRSDRAEQQLPSIDRRRADVPRQPAAAATATTSGWIRATAIATS